MGGRRREVLAAVGVVSRPQVWSFVHLFGWLCPAEFLALLFPSLQGAFRQTARNLKSLFRVGSVWPNGQFD